MSRSITQTQLHLLRPGDRVNYSGVQWGIKEYSTYNDPKGYETTEWLLRSPNGAEYYLLREIDPQNPQSLVNWYLAEEIREPCIFQPQEQINLVAGLCQYIQAENTPYPELKMLNRVYEFESQTKGTYEEDNQETSRLTWDYWDKPHLWNLAIEAWQNGELHIYSTKVVYPEAFSQVVSGGDRKTNWLRILSWTLGVTGFLFIIVGCTMLTS